MKVIENKEHDVKDVLESQALIDEIMTWHDILVIKKTKDTDAIAIEKSTDCQREREAKMPVIEPQCSACNAHG